MKIEIRQTPFDPWAEVAAHQAGLADLHGRHGACTVFVGSMRDFNEGDAVRAMHLEHYPGMTERHLEAIVAEAARRWPVQEALVIHRVGDLEPGDPIVLVAVWSAHRKAAYEANRFIMEDLKSRAPFWKKERLATGQRWVAANTPG